MEITTVLCAFISAGASIAIALINKKTNKKLDVIKNIENKIDTNEKDHLRFSILSFAGDLRNGVKKTRQEFETIFAFHDKYEEIIRGLKQHNGYCDSEFEFIKEKYKKL